MKRVKRSVEEAKQESLKSEFPTHCWGPYGAWLCKHPPGHQEPCEEDKDVVR